jgi:type I restriction enzyme, S subunit
VSVLPHGWAEVSLGDVADARPGFPSGKHNRTGAGIPHLRPMNIDRLGRIDLTDVKYVDERAGEQRLQRDEVLFNNTNSPELVGKTARFNRDGTFAFSNHMTRIRAAESIDAAFLAHQLHWLWMRGLFRSLLSHHVNQASVATHTLLGVSVRLASLSEQQRVVAAIEELFSRLDAAQISLARARKQLVRLRSAALAFGIDGDWPVKQVGEIARTSSGGTPSRKQPEYFGGSIPWVKSGELRDGRVSSTEETITELGLAESSAKIVERGTLLIALYGATVGKLGILEKDAATNQAVCAIKPDAPEMVPYLWYVLRRKRDELIAAGQGGAQPNISQQILRRLLIPVPPLADQHRIVEELERQLSIIDAMEQRIDVALRRGTALRLSILEQAFSGKLVSQDPSDEPASALLERIAAEREAKQPARRRRRTAARA